MFTFSELELLMKIPETLSKLHLGQCQQSKVFLHASCRQLQGKKQWPFSWAMHFSYFQHKITIISTSFRYTVRKSRNMWTVFHLMTQHISFTQRLIFLYRFIFDVEKLENISMQSTNKFVLKRMKLKIHIRTSCKVV